MGRPEPPHASRLLLTANRRLARALRLEADRTHRARGARAWRPLEAHYTPQWLEGVWRDDWSDSRALSRAQEQALWEVVTGAHDAASPPRRDLASLAASAHRLLGEWRLAPDRELEREAAPFLAWRRRFLERSTGEGWLDQERILDRALDLVRDGSAPLPREVEFLGYDRVTPRVRRLEELLRARGCQVAAEPPDCRAAAAPRLVRPPDPREELRLAARWCRAILEREPDSRIAVVLPDLEARAGAVRTAFEEELVPELSLAQRPVPDACPFNVSYAPPLDTRPLVRFALDLVALDEEEIAIEPIGRLLRSPFLDGAETEFAARASSYAALRRTLRRSASLRWLHAFLVREPSTESTRREPVAARFAALIGRAREALAAARADRSPRGWVAAWQSLLAAAGWPGERGLDSTEHQTLRRFEALLDDFAALDEILGTLPRTRALSHLARLAATTSFQPESGIVPVQVLGVLEATGASFVALWLAGMHDEAWPAPSAPHPLLPAGWQRRHGLPNTSHSEELARAAAITKRLLASAPEVVVSVPETDGEHSVGRSPLIPDLPRLDVEYPASAPRERLARCHGSASLETVETDPAPRLRERERQRGGVRVLDDQAACPFRAFARHRLGAQPLARHSRGLDATQRGIMLHGVLERLWREWRDSATLRGLAAPERDQAIAAAVRAVCAIHLDGREDLPAVFRRLEEERTCESVAEWLAVESEREDFRVVGTEVPVPVVRGPLELTLRIDRIDEIRGGRRVVIDYKTGAERLTPDWLAWRLEELQLPLYATLLGETCAAVAFAMVHPGKKRQFRGLAAAEDVLPGVHGYVPHDDDAPRDWARLLGFWGAATTKLAEEFAAGCAAVDPKEPRNTCLRCDLHSLCRIDERGPCDEAEEEEVEGNGAEGER